MYKYSYFSFICIFCVLPRTSNATVTRYECEFTIDTPMLLHQPGHVHLNISFGRDQTNFYQPIRSQTAVTVRLHVEKDHRTVRKGSKTQPKCNGAKVKNGVVRSVGDYGHITVWSKTLSMYVAKEHPEDCKKNQIGFPESDACNNRGNLCLSLKTGIKKCRCKAEYSGENCGKLSLI